jgi:RNA polymerase sigma-70 factor (ECF subfamily)
MMLPTHRFFRTDPRGWQVSLRAWEQALPTLAWMRPQPTPGPAPSISQGALRVQRLEPFESFVHQHERALLNYLWRLLGNEQSAYDLTQEAFVRAWQHFEQISRYEQPRAWLFRVATNLALNHKQRQGHPVGAAVPLDASRDHASSDPALRVAERDLVQQILLQLPPKRRAALVLREVYGLSAEEVGNILGMRREAVKMTLSRARAQFRQLYLQEEAQA